MWTFTIIFSIATLISLGAIIIIQRRIWDKPNVDEKSHNEFTKNYVEELKRVSGYLETVDEKIDYIGGLSEKTRVSSNRLLEEYQNNLKSLELLQGKIDAQRHDILKIDRKINELVTLMESSINNKGIVNNARKAILAPFPGIHEVFKGSKGLRVNIDDLVVEYITRVGKAYRESRPHIDKEGSSEESRK